MLTISICFAILCFLLQLELSSCAIAVPTPEDRTSEAFPPQPPLTSTVANVPWVVGFFPTTDLAHPFVTLIGPRLLMNHSLSTQINPRLQRRDVRKSAPP
ncbi:hypothetical protein QCA50_011762 [Cerrena zonata]|uniref:Secreted protein n=1 Tax=Cerrena zonata TaxID=2478898 RepID=A0AAW0G5K1_9APHY